MPKKITKSESPAYPPLLMTASAMSKVSGLGENTLRTLMANNEIEFLQIGSHRLLCINAIWQYYETHKTPAKPAIKAHFDALYKRDSA